ncbi:MAG TPA: helix-turn-helix domain-containing protein [Caulobacteraceae bacterium]|jgi:transcriptional regulator with XRE-family HTH domain
MTDDPNLGRRPNYLRAWREFRGLTQAQLAAVIGTEGSVISLLESGDQGLSNKWLRRLAAALDTVPSLLLDFDPGSLDSAILELWKELSEPARGRLLRNDVPEEARNPRWSRARPRTDDLGDFDARIDPGFDIPELWSRIADEHKPAALAALKALIRRH